jgi:hypothetical protein
MRCTRAQHPAAAGAAPPPPPPPPLSLISATHAVAQAMLRQAAEEKEFAIKMRAALQAELAQKQPRPAAPLSLSAVATSQELEHGRAQLLAWAAAQAVDDVMQRMLREVCQQRPVFAAATQPLDPERVTGICASMAAASALLLQPVAAQPVEGARLSQQASERAERAVAEAEAARAAAAKENLRLKEVRAPLQPPPPPAPPPSSRGTQACDEWAQQVKHLKIDLDRRALEVRHPPPPPSPPSPPSPRRVTATIRSQRCAVTRQSAPPRPSAPSAAPCSPMPCTPPPPPKKSRSCGSRCVLRV